MKIVNGGGQLDSSEILTKQGWQTLGPAYPEIVISPCIVVVDSKTILVTGGDSNATYYYGPNRVKY